MESSAPDEPTPWSRGCVSLSDGHVEATRDILAAGSLALDDPTLRQCIESEHLCQKIFNV
jgi:hypothetical protein